ncbi:hypothetical protein SHIRM173S_09565 [Streptomyces hirsutus]
MVGCVDAEQGQAVGQHRPGGFGEREPGAVDGRGFLRAERQHGGEQRLRGIGDGDEMPGEPVGSAVPCGGRENAGVVGEGGEQRPGSVRIDGAGLGAESEVGGVAQEGAGPGVGVPHPEEGVALPLGQVLRTDPRPVVRRGQRPPRGVPAERQRVGGGGHGADLDPGAPAEASPKW